MQIVSRAQWGARPPKSRVTGDTVTATFLHHSVGYGPGGSAYMRIMQNQHMDTNGWSDIAYNFVVDPGDLRVFEGRGWGVRPGSQKSYNRGTWSVCVMGDYRTATPTQGLLATIAELISFGADLGHIPLVLSGGHRDAPNQSTTCPGDRLHSRIPEIRNLLEDDMPLTQADADLVANTLLARNLPIASIPLLTALDRNYRNVNELTVAHRAGNLGTTAFAEIEDDDLADIAKAVNDELARRTQG